jgi:hypothetical protein
MDTATVQTGQRCASSIARPESGRTLFCGIHAFASGEYC